MRAQTFLIVGLALLGAWIVRPKLREEVRAHEGASFQSRASEPSKSEAGPGMAAPPPTSRRAPPIATRLPVAPTELAETHEARTQIMGRCLETNGAPCENARVLVRSVPDEVLSARLAQRPPEILREVWTGPAGQFALEAPNEVARAYFIRLERLGRAPIEWRLDAVPGRASRFDLQAVRLERTGTLRGVVHDSTGEALARGWTVHARRLDVPEGMHRVAATHSARPGDSTLAPRRGQFEFTALAPGTYELVTRFIDGVVKRGPEFEVFAGEERHVEVLRRAAPLSSAIVCELACDWPLPADLASDDFVLTSAAGETVPLKLRGSRLAAYGLEEESYTLETRDGRFTASRMTGLRPGGLPRTWTLHGAESLQLDVRSALTGERIEGAWIQIRSAISGAPIQTLRAAHESPSVDWIGGLALTRRQPTLLLAGAPGWVTEAPLELAPDPLQTQRTVEIRLRPGAWIQGRFTIRGKSAPFPEDLDLYVHELSRDGEHWQSAPTAVLPLPGRGDGRFVLEALPPGKLLLEARSPEGAGGFHGSTIAPALAQDAPATPLGIRQVRIELEAPAHLDLTFAGLPPDFDATREFAGYEARLVDRSGHSRAATLRAQSLFAGPLAPGNWQIELQPREAAVGPAIRLATLSLQSGIHSVALEPHLPARVETDLRVDGIALPEARVRLRRAGESWTATSRLDGLAALGLVPAGDYEITVHGPDTEPWTVELPGLLSVEEGDRRVRAIDLHRVPGEILLIDGLSSTDPLRDALVVLSWRCGDEWREVERRTDRRGFLSAELPAGTSFVLSRSGRAFGQHSPVLPTLQWTRNGPSRSVLRLPY